MSLFVVSILSTGIGFVPADAQQPAAHSKRGVALTRETSATNRIGAMRVRSIGRAALAAPQPRASTPPSAPGVVQVFVSQGSVFATFIATSTIPKGVTFGGSVSSDNGTYIQFDDVTFNSGLAPGDYVQLPQFSHVGDLFPGGTVTYTVDVTIDQQLTESNGEFHYYYPPVYSDLQTLTPVIFTTAQSVASNKDMMLAIKGLFTSDTPLVVLSSYDQEINFAVPTAAVTGVTANQIDIDLSQVPGLDLSSLYEYQLTVSQAGFADTLFYRYVPAAPKTFNLAPQ